MEDTRKVLCERCKQFFPYSLIKYMPKGNDARIALCESCRAKFKTDSKIGGSKSGSSSSKKPYFCARCRYKFKFDHSGLTNLKCPYCGKDDKIIKDDVPNTERLLRDADYYG